MFPHRIYIVDKTTTHEVLNTVIINNILGVINT